MGEQSRLKRERKAFPTTPHVILIMGAHVPGIRREVERVIETEKPVAFSTEFFAHPKTQRDLYLELLLRGFGLSVRTNANTDFGTEMQALAEARGIQYLPAEQTGKRFFEHVMKKLQEAESHNEHVLARAESGDVDGAIGAYNNYRRIMRDIGNTRDQHIAAVLAQQARAARGKIAMFVGSAHEKLIDVLRRRGFRVTVYRTDFDHPFASFDHEHLPEVERNKKVKALMAAVFRKYLIERYNLSEFEALHISTIVPSIRNLKERPVHELEELLHEAQGKTKAGARQRLVDFLEKNKVNLPSNSEMETLRGLASPFPIIKAETFEPLSRKA